MKVLLINPSLKPLERYGFAKRSGSYLPPLGLLYIGTVLRNKGIEVLIIDECVDEIDIIDLIKIINENKITIVGFSVLTPTYSKALMLANLIKKTNPELFIVFGGPHISALPYEALQNKDVDFVIVGEGEYAFYDLVDALLNNKDYRKIAGLGYKNGDKTVINNPKRVENLDELPFPDRSLLSSKKYRPSIVHYKKLPSFSIITSRGCPYKCRFCACSKVFGRKIIQRSVENVIEEIKLLISDFGAKEIMIWDDIFGFNREWLIEFCKKIEKLKVFWSCWMRSDYIDAEILKYMKNAGCWNISLGVESGDDMVLKCIEKEINLEQVRKVFKLCKEFDIETRATFIFGFPEDTKESIEKTINFAIEIDPDYAQFQIFTPYPGTNYWECLINNGWSPKDYVKHTIWDVCYIPKNLTEKDLRNYVRIAYKKFYFRPKYILNALTKIRSVEDVKRYVRGFWDII